MAGANRHVSLAVRAPDSVIRVFTSTGGIATRRSRLVVALVLAAVGIVWIGQGAGFIGGSAMTGSTFWAVVGALLLAAAAAVVLVERRVTHPR